MLIRRGDRGPTVVPVQSMINRASCGHVSEDGIFGKNTERAVKRFQAREGLGVDGIVGPNTLAALQRAVEPSDTHVPDSSDPAVIRAMSAKGYDVHVDGQINIVGVRTSTQVPNAFDDHMHLVWISKGKWQEKVFVCTTDPGTYWLENPMNVQGTAILVPGQYPVYKWDMHRGKYEALCQRSGKVSVYRDGNKDNVLDWHDSVITEGYYGINLHHAGTASTQVDKWSAGCQVIAKLADWKKAFKIWKSSEADLFTYTLIVEADLEGLA